MKFCKTRTFSKSAFYTISKCSTVAISKMDSITINGVVILSNRKKMPSMYDLMHRSLFVYLHRESDTK